jgi:hypothetical protein
MKIVGAIVVLVAVPLVVMALHGSSPWLARKLVRQAARRLPEPYGERYQEEWQAELAAMPDGGLITLVFALCIRLRVGNMKRRLNAPSISKPEQQPEQLGITEREWKLYLEELNAHDAGKASIPFQDLLKETTGSEHLVTTHEALKATSVETYEVRITQLMRASRSTSGTPGFWRRRRR